jgi:hypothetical protein
MKNFISSLRKPFTILSFSLLALGMNAQIDMPQPSPGASFTQKVGMTELKVEYSRPSAKGRKIMGDVVPLNNELWRTGANTATKFTTSDSITIAGKGLPKGTYILMTRPGADEWEIIFNKNQQVSASNYKPEDDVLKVKVKSMKLPYNVETFTISTNNITSSSCDVELMWENTIVKIPVTNDVDGKVMAQIKQKLDGPTQSEYFSMSQYYFDSGKDIKQALEFANKAEAKGERFWMLRHKSLILAKMGDKAAAIKTAKRSLELAKEAKNNDYIRMNEASLAEWAKM